MNIFRRLKIPKMDKRQKKFLSFFVIVSIIVVTVAYFYRNTPIQQNEGYVMNVSMHWKSEEVDRASIQIQVVLNDVVVDTIPYPTHLTGFQLGTYLFDEGDNVTVIVTNYQPESDDPVIIGTGDFVVGSFEVGLVKFFEGDVQLGSVYFDWVWSVV